MLRVCSQSEFASLVDFAYGLAADLTKSGYPSYCDGIKTKADFVERAGKAFERQTEEMLVFEQAGEVRGLIHYFWLPEDRYIETVSFNIDGATEEALSEFLAYLGERFPGYEAYLGFPAENTAAVRFFAERGIECIEADYNNTAYPDRLEAIPESPGVVLIGRENYERFRSLHCQLEGDMYWNSERIFADLANWVVLVLERDGRPQGAAYCKDLGKGWYEMFGVDIDGDRHDPALMRELLNAALAEAKRRNGRFVTFFCEEEYEETAKECGFQCVGSYRCYHIKLK